MLGSNVLLVIVIKSNAKQAYRFHTATMLLVYILQKMH
jgi:hypothetical protein